MKPTPYGNLIEVAVEPKPDTSRQKLNDALVEIAEEDSALTITMVDDVDQVILGGGSEKHLDDVITHLKKTAGDNFNIGAPQVAYRETLIASSIIDYTHKRLVGSSGEFARVILQFEPAQAGMEFVFENKVSDNSVPDVFVPAVELGLEQQRKIGLLVGFPFVEIKATLIGGAYHEEDSGALTFQTAAKAAFKKLKKSGHVVLIEPIMKLEIVLPETFVGPLIADINSRRGAIVDQHFEKGSVTLEAEVPLGQLFGYVNSIRALSEGHARHTMTFDHYARVPSSSNDDDDPRFPSALGMRA